MIKQAIFGAVAAMTLLGSVAQAAEYRLEVWTAGIYSGVDITSDAEYGSDELVIDAVNALYDLDNRRHTFGEYGDRNADNTLEKHTNEENNFFVIGLRGPFGGLNEDVYIVQK